MRSAEAPTVSVAVRTTGERPASLERALESIEHQTAAPTEVLVAWHDIGRGGPPTVGDGVRVLEVRGGQRGRPLNAALDVAASDYLAYLDDDDLALPTWIEVFQRGAMGRPGAIIRAVTADRPVHEGPDGEPVAEGPDEVPEGREDRFDLFTMLTRSRTPICSVALPVAAIRDHALRFAEDLPVLEDWHFLIRAASVLPVHDTGVTTSIYHRWTDGRSSLDAEGRDVWAATRAQVIDRLDNEPLVLPPGSASRLLRLFEAEQEAREAVREAERLGRRISQMEGSTSWRVTAPMRRLLDAARRAERPQGEGP